MVKERAECPDNDRCDLCISAYLVLIKSFGNVMSQHIVACPSLLPSTPCLRNLHDNAAMSSFGVVNLAS